VRRYPVFTFGNSELQVVDDYTYLGTVFNYNGRFNKAITKQVNQARRAMYSLLTKAKQLMLPLDVQCELFDQLCIPILLYGCEVWGFQNIDQVEIFYRKFLKNILRVNKKTANCMVYGETGRLGIREQIDKRMINFWTKLIQGKQSKLSVTMYKLMKEMYNANMSGTQDCKSRWIEKIKSILDENGYTHAWDEQNYVNINWLRKSIALRISDTSKQKWSAEVNRNGLCINYRIFKDSVCFENYLIMLDDRDRINLCRFRCGNHRLPINEKRYSLSNDSTSCLLCNSNQPGDEYHYTLVCPAFTQLRKKYIKRFYYIRPNTLKFKQLFNSNRKQLSNLARFVDVIMKTFLTHT